MRLVEFAVPLDEKITATMHDNSSLTKSDGLGGREETKKISLNLNKLIRHEMRPKGLQYVRSEKLITDIANSLKQGKSIPPIIVHRTQGPNGELIYKIINGHHRVEAARRAKMTTIDAIVLDKNLVDYSNVSKKYKKNIIR